jgi:transcriptional regulator with XRE-family HTH domain
MTQIEQIKAEIERLTEVTGYALSEYENGRRSAMYDIRKQLTEYINSLPAEQPSEELEKEIESYLITNRQYAGGDEEDLWGDDCIRDAIKYGANWQKEQIMKSAVDATCVLLPPPDLFKVLICHDVTNNLSKGQKVKIITVTVKEDEQ